MLRPSHTLLAPSHSHACPVIYLPPPPPPSFPWPQPQFHGETALHLAVVHNDLEMAMRLLDAGADIDAQADGLFFYERLSTYFGGPPVGVAAQTGDVELMELLASRGANLHFVDEGCLRTVQPPSMEAPSVLHEWEEWHSALKNLLRVRTEESEARTPRQLGSDVPGRAGSGSDLVLDARTLARRYLSEGGEPFCSHGTTILHVAVLHGRARMLHRLAEDYQVPMHLRNAWGQTPLLMAACQGTKEVFEAALSSAGRTLWEFGRLKSIEFPLLEYVSSAHAPARAVTAQRTSDPTAAWSARIHTQAAHRFAHGRTGEWMVPRMASPLCSPIRRFLRGSRPTPTPRGFALCRVDSQLEDANDGLPSVLRTLVTHRRLDLLQLRQVQHLVLDKWCRCTRFVFTLQSAIFLGTLVLLAVHIECSGTLQQCAPWYYALLVTTTALVLLFMPPLTAVRSAASRLRARCFASNRARLTPQLDAPSKSSLGSGSDESDLSSAALSRMSHGQAPLSLRRALRALFSMPLFVLLIYLSIPLHPAALGRQFGGKLLVFAHRGCHNVSHAIVAGNRSDGTREGADDPAEEEECTALLSANVVLSVAAIIGWARFVSLVTSASKYFGPFVRILVQMILNDVGRFIVFYAILIISFSTALIATARTYPLVEYYTRRGGTLVESSDLVLATQATPVVTGDITLANVVVLLLRVPFDDANYIQDGLSGHPVPHVATPLVLLFEVLVNLVLVNLLCVACSATCQPPAHAPAAYPHTTPHAAPRYKRHWSPRTL